MAAATVDVVSRFAGEHFTLNSISQRRQDQVLAALARLAAFLPGDLIDATDHDLRAWMVSLLADDGLAPSTVAWHLKMVMPFYTWCWRSRLISPDDLMRLREVSPPRGYNASVPRPYTRKQLAALWAALEGRWAYAPESAIHRWRTGIAKWPRVKSHAMRLQLTAIIELALVCGLRRNEIYRLSIDDCHWDNKYIVVHGKRHDQNDKVREVPYPDSTREAIAAWFRFRGLMGATTDCLWLSVTGPDPVMALSEWRMKQVLNTLPGDWQLHRLRHTCATERLRAGMELEKLQRFLGHANLQQTMRYAQLVRGDIHKASERIDADFQRAIRPAAAT
jgi:integrase